MRENQGYEGKDEEKSWEKPGHDDVDRFNSKSRRLFLTVISSSGRKLRNHPTAPLAHRPPWQFDGAFRLELRKSALITVCSLLVGLSLFLSETSAEHLALLREQKIGTETGEILAFLDLLLPGSEVNAEIQELIGGLSSLEFEEREAATAKLQSIGMFGRANLIEATKSSDPETAWRTKRILGGLDSDERHLAHRSAVFACLEILKERGDPVSVPTLLSLLGRLDEPTLRGRATEAIWKSADATHADLFQTTL